jgi:hypothetical protein
MKNYSLIAILFANLFCFAQEPNPDLFQTWYLTHAQGSDIEHYINVSEISPSITPTLTISDDYSFTGTGACNTFSGVFTFLESVFEIENMQVSQFSKTTNTCMHASHTSLEYLYFGLMNPGMGSIYEITNNDQGMQLSIFTIFFTALSFQNYPLSSQQLEEQKIQVYPNPSSSKIFIKSDELSIHQIEIYNQLGQRVKNVSQNLTELDISTLEKGIYFMTLHLNNNIITKKIIKN